MAWVLVCKGTKQAILFAHGINQRMQHMHRYHIYVYVGTDVGEYGMSVYMCIRVYIYLSDIYIYTYVYI